MRGGVRRVPLVPLLPVATDVVADVADLVIAGRYIPAGVGPEPIAGDFYDLLVLDDDLVAIVVGDVAGHGVDASARMQQLRAAARAYAVQEPGPAQLIARLDLFCARLDPEAIATLWYGEYRASTGTLTYASAGHPPPVLTVHTGPPMLFESASAPPLGVGVADELVAEHQLMLPPGAILIAYSDGLIERRRADFGDQLALLTEVVTRACDPARNGTADDIAADILNALVPQPDQAEDDVCLLVVRRQPTPAMAVSSHS
jgi:serine phosphatase RsbU (regulator of sigma subunit)